MTETPKTPETPETPDLESITELVFQTNPLLVLAAFVAGALIIAGIVYYIGTRTEEGESDATD